MLLIDFKNVNISHLDGESVLKGVNFHVDEGEFIYLIGRVGAGKSSLLKTIYMEMDIDSADEATVLGKDLTTMRRRDIPELRRQMGIIFQDFKLCDRPAQSTDRTGKSVHLQAVCIGSERGICISRCSR